MDYDVVWVWLEDGQRWNGIDVAPLPTKKARRDAARACRMEAEERGYVTRMGMRSIGPPEGAPEEVTSG
jgi:hypothetical protein